MRWLPGLLVVAAAWLAAPAAAGAALPVMRIGPYNDKTLLRNVVAYRTARWMGRYAARTRFVKLRLDGRYHGVYVARGSHRAEVAFLRSWIKRRIGWIDRNVGRL